MWFGLRIVIGFQLTYYSSHRVRRTEQVLYCTLHYAALLYKTIRCASYSYKYATMRPGHRNGRWTLVAAGVAGYPHPSKPYPILRTVPSIPF